MPIVTTKGGYPTDSNWAAKKDSSVNHHYGLVLAAILSKHLVSISSDQLREGDVIAFSVKLREGYPDHVGIAAGGGRFIHATKGGVTSTPLTQTWLRCSTGFYRMPNG